MKLHDSLRSWFEVKFRFTFKKLFAFVVLAVIAYWVGAYILIENAPYRNDEIDAKTVLTASIMMFGGIATFFAVIWSLFGQAFLRRFNQPVLRVDSSCDDLHCSFIDVTETAHEGIRERKIDVFVSALNTSYEDAPDAQIICNRLFVSTDGEHFEPFGTFRGAAFRWLYSTDSDKYLTTLRHSVSKYVKVLKIVDEERYEGEDGSLNISAEGKRENKTKVRSVHFELCLESDGGAESSIRIDSKYIAVLVPLHMTTSATKTIDKCLKVYWKGELVQKAPTRDILDIKMLSKSEAEDAVKVRII